MQGPGRGHSHRDGICTLRDLDIAHQMIAVSRCWSWDGSGSVGRTDGAYRERTCAGRGRVSGGRANGTPSAQESIPSIRVVQLARERGEDELVGVAPRINQACSRDSSHTFSEGIWRHEVEQGE